MIVCGGRWDAGIHGQVGRGWGWRRAASVRLDRAGEGDYWLGSGWVGVKWGAVLCLGVRNAQHMDWAVTSSLPLDRMSLPPWRGGGVKSAHHRERALDPVTLGIIRSFVCALSSAFLAGAEQGSRRDGRLSP